MLTKGVHITPEQNTIFKGDWNLQVCNTFVSPINCNTHDHLRLFLQRSRSRPLLQVLRSPNKLYTGKGTTNAGWGSCNREGYTGMEK